ncbi:E3 ubiquitin-protein ligase BRE1-like [Phoenix dactylifera]|uniref:E3 ubiquitin-protein ligase BRE1-like n=1 Tax=Phoenix dactylifera TaxID=42345 RepID=A0A8B7CMC3_PHODC|nr:E3 ubiquitin-protein ligase BRE1-like [Phoenix dactylifera]XP_038985873.1 E3 ubiquitin-protein ligase BRE1-like [Phoenix dactylifera]
MSTWELLRRSGKRQARDGTRVKMVLNVDLNVPPLESWSADGASGSAHPCVSQGAAVPVNPQCSHSTRGQQGVVPTSNNGLSSLPIDVEALEDEVEMLSSLREFPQTRNHARRNQPVTVVLDGDLESRPRQSGVAIGEPVTTLFLNTHNKRERIPTNMTIINCDLYLDPEEENNEKKRALMKSNLEPEKVVAKEPTFTCPVCMNPLVEASSTICGHIFCDSCIKASIKTQKKCPTCRRKLTMNNFHRVYLPTID